jgi:hypothetical protein
VLDPAFCNIRRLAAIAAVATCASLSGCSSPWADSSTAVTQYDPQTGRLKRIEFDTTKDGRNDAVGIMDGTRVERIEVDEDEDGKIDRWEFYDEHRRLQRIGFSRHNNGAIDALAFYGGDGELQRIEMSTRADGHFDRVEYYQSESLARVEEDTNGDGRTDKWETYAVRAHATPNQSPSIATAAFDDSFRGKANRRLVYGEQGTVPRVEVDPDGDGIFVEASPSGSR